MKNNIREYLAHHNACEDGLEWCVANCTSMEDVWKKLERHDWMMWLISDAKCLTDRECHEFGLWCAERVEHLMEDPRSVAALKAKRGWINGNITNDELAAARKVAQGAWKADEVGAAAWAVAWAVPEDRTASWTAAWTASSAAAGVDGDVTLAAVETAQLAWLRANTKPVFEMEGT